MTAILLITDGTETVDLLNSSGIHLDAWAQNVLGYKSDGIWQDSPLANGRQLAMTRYANVIDEFRIKARGSAQDNAIKAMQDLVRLLQKGTDFWTTTWQDEPVYITAKATSESNTRYALVKSFRVDALNNPFAQPFLQVDCTALFDGVGVFIEHGPWQDTVIGTSIAARAGTERSINYQGWILNSALPGAGGQVNAWGIAQNPAGDMIVLNDDQTLYTADGINWNVAVMPALGVTQALTACTWFSATGRFYISGWLAPPINDGMIWESTDATGAQFAAIGATGEGTYTDNGNRRLIDGLNGYLYIVDQPRTLRRSADGITWTAVGTGIPAEFYATCLSRFNSLVVPGSVIKGAIVVAGITNGTYPALYYTQDGVTWSPGCMFWTSGYGAPTFLFDAGDYLFMGTENGQIFRFSAGLVCDSSMPGSSACTFGLKIPLYIQTLSARPNDMARASDGYYYIGDTGTYTWVGDGTSFTRQPAIPSGINGVDAMLLYAGNDCIYAAGSDDISYLVALDVGQEPTDEDIVFIANKENTAPITHAYNYDAGGATYTRIYPETTFPVQLFPAVMANNDALYIGCDTGIIGLDTGTFTNVVFDIGTPASGTYTLTWQYWNGAWVALTTNDETNSFVKQEVGCLNWTPPSDWTTTAVNGITGYWIRGIISAIAGAPVGPTQDNRNLYTVTWSGIEVEEGENTGDIPALSRVIINNRGDKDAYTTVTSLDLLDNRMVIGLRTNARGPQFVPFLNCSDEQNPVGITVSVSTGTAFATSIPRAPTTRMARHTTTALGVTNYSNAVTLTFGPGIARDFYGEYHVFARAHLEEPSSSPAGDMDDVRVRLKIQSGSGGIQYTTDYVRFNGVDDTGLTYNDHQLLDFKRVSFPVSGLFKATELPDEFSITIQVSSVAATNLYADFYDIILIPVDEWSGNFEDTAFEDDSGVFYDSILDVDSATYQKRAIRTMVREITSDGLIRASYQSITPGPAILQANVDQRYWFLSCRAYKSGRHTGANNAAVLTDAQADFLRAGVRPGMTIHNQTDGSTATVTAVTATTVTGTLAGGAENDWDTNDVYWVVCPNWRSDPWAVHSARVEKVARYLAMRGAR